ncbi:MAG: oligosaccharide flippase family protein [Rhodoferax sp.]
MSGDAAMVVKAGVISVGALLIGQLIRFLANIFLAKYLAPSAFGMVGIVNMILLGINLFSDIGLRQLVIQKKDVPTREFLDTVWVVQIVRGIVILMVALMGALLIAGLQHFGMAIDNVYANPLVPALIAGAALSALTNGFESTKVLTARRNLDLNRVTAFVLTSQVCSVLVMVAIAKATASPWALIAGAISSSILQVMLSHLALPGLRNKLRLDKALAVSLLKRGRWILLASPLTFLSANAEVFILGGLVNASLLGNYMIAFLLANVVHQIATTLSLNVFFPALSRSAVDGVLGMSRAYLRYQLMSDALIVTAGGFLLAAGPAFVSLFFDDRYSMAGKLLSALAIGLVGVRYHVIEQLMNAQGKFKFGALLSSLRLTFVVVGTFGGYHFGGLTGAALGAGMSWFSGWPVLLWFRAKCLPWPWRYELAAITFLASGYALGNLFTQLVERFHLRIVH